MKMFKNKNFLMYKDKITPCLLNECQMTVIEHMYCKIFVWKSIPRDFKILVKDMIKGLIDFFACLSGIVISPITFIIILPLESFRTIEDAKRKVFNHYCTSCQNYNKSIDKCNNCKLIKGEATNYIEIV